MYGSGVHWGTAYLGPDGHAPDSAGTLAATEPVTEPAPAASLALEAEAALAPGPELVDISAGESLLGEPLPGDVAAAAAQAAAPAPARRARVRRLRVAPSARVTSRWTSRVTSRRWAAEPASEGYPGPKTPADVRFVFWALIAVIIAVAVIIAILVTR